MGNLSTAMKNLCCCTSESRTAPNEIPIQLNGEQPAAVIPTHFNQPPPAPGWINPMSTAYNIRSEEVGTEVRNEYILYVVKSNTPTEHSLDTLSNVRVMDDPTYPVSS